MKRAIQFFSTVSLALMVPMFAHAVTVAPDSQPEDADQAELNPPLEETIADKEIDVAVDTDYFPSTNENKITLSTDDTFVANDYIHITEVQGSDVYAAGNTIVVSDDIHGDLHAAGNSITLERTIMGDARLAGSTIVIDGEISGNAVIFANTVIVNEDAAISGNLHVFAATVALNGTVGRATNVYAASANLNGAYLGSVHIQGEEVLIGENATLHTPSAVTADSLRIHNDANGTAYIEYSKPENEQWSTYEKKKHLYRYKRFVRSYFLFLALGILLVLLWPKWVERSVKAMKKYPKQTWGKGALFVFATPAVLLFSVMTIIGIPFALAGGLAYMVLMALGRIIVGIWFGQLLVNEKKHKNPKVQWLLCLIVGYFILSVLMNLPVFGWLFTILAAMWGSGAVIEAHKRKRKRSRRSRKK